MIDQNASFSSSSSNARDKIHRTIEDELVEAFVKIGAIPQAHADDMSKVRMISKRRLN